MAKLVAIDNEYKAWLSDLKHRIKGCRIKAVVKVNAAMLELYWSIGSDIVEKQAESKWGAGVIKHLSRDLRSEFPDIHGFSESNLKYMRRFYQFYSSALIGHRFGDEFSEQKIGHQVGDRVNIYFTNIDINTDSWNLLSAIPWRHHVEIISRCKSFDEALFYIRKTIENGWSRAMLIHFFESGLYRTQGKSINNFTRLLPEPQSDLAAEIVKDPYNFDFLALAENYREREMENALIGNITKFLLELGQGFSYVGRQIPIRVGEKEMYLDILFYHLELRCFIVLELKATEFEAEHVGKLGVYVAAVNHLFKKAADNPTIGLIVCKSKDKIMAEYAVESSSQPIGISEYELSKLIPESYKSKLPTIEEIEEELTELK
jgi:predicted nuclease of restriction endonuclease-like (RecB) superfamily